MPNSTSISTVIEGVWNIGTPPVMGTHSTQTIREKWRDGACPVELAVQSCYFTGQPKKAEQVKNRIFTPSSCALTEFDAEAFMESIRGRNLIFLGDSLSTQHFQIIVCSLHGSVTAKYNVQWNRLIQNYGSHNCLWGDSFCHIDTAEVYYPDYDARIVLKQLKRVTELTTTYLAQQATTSDIVVMNLGAHYNGPQHFKEYEQELKLFTRAYSNSEVKPLILWRESAPQHFTNGLNGYYNGPAHLCGPIRNLENFHNLDHRNRIAEKVLSAADIPILRIAAPTVLQFDAHVGDSKRQDHLYDCQHYCMPSGALYHWRDLLFNAILAMQT